MHALLLSDPSRILAGAMLLSIVTIEFGGWFVLRTSSGAVAATDFQRSFARAGHGHAGVLVTLGLVCLLLADASGLTGPLGWIARLGVPVAALLVPGGFFASSAGRGRTRPNRAFVLVWLGVASLALGVGVLGIGLLTG
ncbi:hypothetical protein [Umezawaea beigongshangensis]|uniref:hypothetical protein n=1 Tax=Umezawaea beigongshangensis TaxID=2780383 RepID=UPI0018F1195A|nr:hypothetical protein [Umezawaea beigongshangensis]